MKKTIILAVITSLLIFVLGAGSGESEVDFLKTQLAQTEIQLRQARDEIQMLRPEAAAARRLPVVTGKRASILGNGLVFQFQNLSFKQLPVKVTLVNPTFGKTNQYDLLLPAAHPGVPKEIGSDQGWKGASGDLISIQSEGYDSFKMKCD